MAHRTIVGTKSVTTAGTQVQLSTNTQLIEEVTIQALPANSGSIYIGIADVSSTSYGVALLKSEIVTFKPKMISDLWIDSTANGEGVTFIATLK